MSFRILSTPQSMRMDGMVFMPYVRYVLPAGPAQTFVTSLRAQKHEPHTMSVWNSYHRPYAGQPLNGKRIAIYRHAAFGDQLMVTAVAARLAHLFPKAQIDVYCAPNVLEIWAGMPGIRALPAPMHFDALRGYDFHLFFDQLLEEDREPDQGNAYDNLFGIAGLPDTNPVWKRPRIVELAGDLQELNALGLRLTPRKYAVLQLQASNPNRTYPPDQLAAFALAFAAEYPDWLVLVVGLGDKGDFDRFEAALLEIRGRDYERAVEERIVSLVDRLKSFRSLVPLVAKAGLVVCPDSSIGHLAAAFPDTPVISLWGIFHPDDRAKYYANHRPLSAFGVCPHAPCRNHEFRLPQEKCREASNATPGAQTSCNALRAITPAQIFAAAKEILK